jgi:Tol biopolymer transport system component
VRRLDTAGGPLSTVAEFGRSALYGPNGVILFTGQDSRIYRVADTGGVAQPITSLDGNAGELEHLATGFLPDGQRFLFVASNRDPEKSTVYVSSIAGEQRTALPGINTPASYSGGYLWFVQGSSLMARRVDAASLQLSDGAQVVADDVSEFAVSDGGTLITRPREQATAEIAWLDSAGRVQTVVGPPTVYRGNPRPDLSPDGRTLAFGRHDPAGRSDIWTLDLERDVASPLTNARGDDDAPIYSPDGQWIAFASTRNGSRDLYRRRADGSGSDELLLASSENKVPTGFSPDGSLLLFHQTVTTTGADIWILPLTGERKPIALKVTSELEGYATFSPNGKWIAYCSGGTSEGDQVYIEPYPLTGSRIRLSPAVGSSPQWSADGREVFYGTTGGEIMRVPLTFNGHTVQPGVAERMMKAPSLFGHGSFVRDRASRMLTITTSPTTNSAPVAVIVNWPELLRGDGKP